MTITEVDATADRFFGAIEAGQIDAVASMFSDDFTLWLTGGGRTHRKAGAVSIIGWLVAVTNDRHYDVLERQHFPGGFVQQHVLRGTILDGTPYSFRVAIIMRLDADGRFSHVDEYLDVTEMGPLQNKDLPRG